MNLLTSGLLFGGLAGAALGVLLRRHVARWSRAAAVVVWMLAALSLASGGYSYWYYHRAAPEEIRNEVLFEGVTRSRFVLRGPRPTVINVVTVDLDAPGISFLVTPPDRSDGYELRAMTTSQFLERNKVQLAVNGGPFFPWYAKGPLSYYPHVGDPVSAAGATASGGVAYGSNTPDRPTMSISRDNRVSMGIPPGQMWNAVTGFTMLLRDGKAADQGKYKANANLLHPRTAAAVDASGRKLMLFVVDGRQPNYSEGMTIPELTEFVRAHGGWTAINLDGGGSTTLAVAGADGKAVVLNSPCHGRIPTGRQRPVATHIGVFAQPAWK